MIPGLFLNSSDLKKSSASRLLNTSGGFDAMKHIYHSLIERRELHYILGIPHVLKLRGVQLHPFLDEPARGSRQIAGE